MHIDVYEDTKDTGDMVLITSGGLVTFVTGPATSEQLAKALPTMAFSSMHHHMQKAHEQKGERLFVIETNVQLKHTFKDGVSPEAAAREALAEGIKAGVDKALEDMRIIENAGTPYKRAVAGALLWVDSFQATTDNAKRVDKHLEGTHPLVGLAFAALSMDRVTCRDALLDVLAQQRTVIEQLQGIAAGQPGDAHDAVRALLDALGMPPGVCSGCGQVHEDAAPAQAATEDATPAPPGTKYH